MRANRRFQTCYFFGLFADASERMRVGDTDADAKPMPWPYNLIRNLIRAWPLYFRPLYF